MKDSFSKPVTYVTTLRYGLYVLGSCNMFMARKQFLYLFLCVVYIMEHKPDESRLYARIYTL